MSNPCTQDCPDRVAGCVIGCRVYAAYQVEIAAKRAARDREIHRKMDYDEYKRQAIQRAKHKSYRRQGS